jgi:ATP-binding cassette, subfamily B, bacterial PglK
VKESLNILISLWKHLSSRRQKQAYLLLILMIVTTLAEIVSIGAILPFLGILIAPEQVFYHAITQYLIGEVGGIFDIAILTSPDQIILPITIIFVVAIVVANVIRVLLLYVSTKYILSMGADVSYNVYQRTLHQEYQVHLARNSSQIINAITNKTNMAISSMHSALIFINSAIFLVGVICVLLFVEPVATLVIFLGFGLFYWGMAKLTKLKIKNNSEIIAEKSTLVVKSLQEGLGGIRDVIIDSSHAFYCNIFRNADLPVRRATWSNIFIAQVPRYIVETVGMILIVILAYFMAQKEGGIEAIPMLGVLALSAQKILPALQQMYASYSSINGAKASSREVLKLLNQKVLKHPLNIDSHDSVRFNQEIRLNEMQFRYSRQSPLILKSINLKIHKGECIGFIGVSGSGKSTLVDIIMGLLVPTVGDLIVDGNVITDKNRDDWYSKIAHVPQKVFLSDTTITQNIAFGIPKDEINQEQVEDSARKAEISEMIKGLPQGYETIVGEQGVKLSGGERQRLGIARALYKRAKLLVLDEATSALDIETERRVMNAVNNLKNDITILVIAHRLTTLKNCNKIVELDGKNGVKEGSYSEIIKEKM